MKKLYYLLSLLPICIFSSCANSGDSVNDLNPVVADKNFPVAHQYKTSTTQVISPYRPHNVVNVKGMKPGHLARDTSTAKRDKNGKPIISTAKIFRIPEFNN
jgi:hypothetical protein